MHYLLVMAVTFVLVFGIAKFLQSQLGGLTGDTYGALTECGNVLYLLTLIIGGRFWCLAFILTTAYLVCFKDGAKWK